jgi:RHS repeat-associated protein
LRKSPRGSYEYNAAGFPTRRKSPAGSWDLRYDPLGRMTEARGSDGTSVVCGYDPLFRRRTKTTAAGTRKSCWAGDALFQEQLADGTLIRYIVHPVDWRPLAFAVGPAWYYVVTDQHGQATDVIRADNHQIVWSETPLGFRSEPEQASEALPFAIRALGQQFDPETGMVYQRARYYEPREGRFLSPDPIGLMGGWNLYRFCLNQPLRFVDPLGLTCPSMSQADCDDLLNDISGQATELDERFDEMKNPDHILPWDGSPPVWVTYGVTRGTYSAPHTAADGTPIAAGEKSSGSVESHLKQYNDVQKGMNRNLQKYNEGGCYQYHQNDPAARATLDNAGNWSSKRPELPSYPEASMPDNCIKLLLFP